LDVEPTSPVLLTSAIFALTQYNSVLIEHDGAVMFIRGNGQNRGICIAGVVMMLAAAPASLGQTTSNQENEPASSDTQEEIIVYGRKNLVILRRELYTAEEDFLAKFNSINSDDKFDF